MNNAETQQILEHIKTMYGKAYTADTIRLWTMTLQDVPFNDASYALVAWFQTEHWAPLPSDIRAKVYNLKTGPDALASQAWEQLLRALRNAYAPESEKVWEELPEATKTIVGGYATFKAWGNTETTSLESVQRPMFIKRFEELQARNRKEGAAQPKFREPIPALPNACPEQMIPQIEDQSGNGVPAPEDRMKKLRERLGGVT